MRKKRKKTKRVLSVILSASMLASGFYPYGVVSAAEQTEFSKADKENRAELTEVDSAQDEDLIDETMHVKKTSNAELVKDLVKDPILFNGLLKIYNESEG